VQGYPDVYPQYGKLTFKVDVITPVGEGALRLAFEILKTELKEQGYFRPERKRPIPDYVQCVGLITSETGVVYRDFCRGLGNSGKFVIRLFSPQPPLSQPAFRAEDHLLLLHGFWPPGAEAGAEGLRRRLRSPPRSPPAGQGGRSSRLGSRRSSHSWSTRRRTATSGSTKSNMTATA
jgi:hypothetical protein